MTSKHEDLQVIVGILPLLRSPPFFFGHDGFLDGL